MNLMLEYLLESGELNNRFKPPYSIFLTKPNNDVVLVISDNYLYEKLTIKHWMLSKCKKNDLIPPFVEFEIEKEDLYSSDKVIMPEYNLLWYNEEPFVAGKVQHTDMPFAKEDENEYNNCLDNILNSIKHKEARANWLWNIFLKTYNLDIQTTGSIDGDIGVNHLKNVSPMYQNNWKIWKKYLLDYSREVGNIAGELLFHKQYVEQAKKEGRKINLNPPQKVKPNPINWFHMPFPQNYNFNFFT